MKNCLQGPHKDFFVHYGMELSGERLCRSLEQQRRIAQGQRYTVASLGTHHMLLVPLGWRKQVKLNSGH